MAKKTTKTSKTTKPNTFDKIEYDFITQFAYYCKKLISNEEKQFLQSLFSGSGVSTAIKFYYPDIEQDVVNLAYNIITDKSVQEKVTALSPAIINTIACVAYDGVVSHFNNIRHLRNNAGETKPFPDRVTMLVMDIADAADRMLETMSDDQIDPIKTVLATSFPMFDVNNDDNTVGVSMAIYGTVLHIIAIILDDELLKLIVEKIADSGIDTLDIDTCIEKLVTPDTAAGTTAAGTTAAGTAGTTAAGTTAAGTAGTTAAGTTAAGTTAAGTTAAGTTAAGTTAAGTTAAGTAGTTAAGTTAAGTAGTTAAGTTAAGTIAAGTIAAGTTTDEYNNVLLPALLALCDQVRMEVETSYGVTIDNANNPSVARWTLDAMFTNGDPHTLTTINEYESYIRSQYISIALS